MNNQNIHFNLLITIVLFAGLQFTLSGCGGGSVNSYMNDNTTELPTNITSTTQIDTAGSNIALPELEPVTKSEMFRTENKKIVNYASDKSLLAISAFDFDSSKVINIDITATSNDTTSVIDRLSVVSSIDKSIQKKSLLTKVFTDKNGQVIMAFEVPDSVDALLLEISTTGIENKVVYNVDDSSNILHHFK